MDRGKVFVILGVGLVLWYCFFVGQKKTKRSQSIEEVRRRLHKMNPDYDRIPIVENNGASYTEDQNLIHLCVKDPKTQKEYDINILMQVALHEVAHTMTDEDAPEHGTEFTANFNKILKEASKAGVYDINTPEPVGYCGT